ncbi:MAG: ATP-binding cassette domain-containing protein [Phycisphaeraceae bacterium]|nr:ATP-binding cassette domain-containing protein [Phycisphaeraceae bacterium]
MVADPVELTPRAHDCIVRFVDVHRRFGSRRVLQGLSLDVPRRQTLVVLGPSGCGKSVMLRHIVGLVRPDAGEVFVDGAPVHRLSGRALGPIRRRIGFLFQGGALFDSMTIGENVEFPLREHARMDRAARRARADDLLDLVGLADTRDRMPADLSGGQRKRAALARAIALDPPLVLYDEPTTGLDPIRAEAINELILHLRRTRGVTGIVVTHDIGSALRIADETVLLHEGRVRFRGSPQALRTSSDPVVRRFLAGEPDWIRPDPPAVPNATRGTPAGGAP